MRNLFIALTVVLAAGCMQERKKSLEVMNRGVEAGRQKLWDSAVRDLKEALMIDPTNGQAAYNLGIVYKDQKKWAESAEAFGTAAKLDASNPSLHYEMGSALFEDKKIQEAKGAFETALKLDPKLYKAHYRLGLVLQTEEKYKEADAAYRKAIEANPRFLPPYLSLGNLYLDNEYEKEAGQVFRNAILADDANGEAHQGLAEALQSSKNYEDAIKEFKRAVELNPRLFIAYYNIGHTYKLLNDKKNAKEWLEKFQKTYASAAGPELVTTVRDELYALDAPEAAR